MHSDVLILTALPKEYQAVIKALDAASEKKSSAIFKRDGRDYHIYKIDKLTVAVPGPTGMGLSDAAIATADALHDLSTRVVLLVGIAGSLTRRPSSSSKAVQVLGDLVVANHILDYALEKDKEEVAEDGKVSERFTELRPKSSEIWEPLVAHINRRLQHGGQPVERRFDPSWTKPAAKLHHHRPAIHIGTILSGNRLLASKAWKEELLKSLPWNPKPIAVEMEAAGVGRCLARTQGRHRPFFLVVKSICDWGERDKDDDIQDYCATAAASYALHILRRDVSELLPKGSHALHEAHDAFAKVVNHGMEDFFSSADVEPQVLAGTAEAVQKAALHEIQELAQNKLSSYTADLSTGSQYLLRARPLFEKATRAFVTSIDTVSTFWTDPASQGYAQDYIRLQTTLKEAYRLFVFSTPESAHRHTQVLDANVDAYGNVFVCSIDSYKKLLKSCIAPRSVEDYLRKDFALLEYGDGKPWLAELDRQKFNFRRLTDDVAIQSGPTMRLFELLADIEAGKCGELIDGANGNLSILQEPDTGKPGECPAILRWRRNLGGDTSWADILEGMFGVPQADAFHIVSFDINEDQYDDIKQALAEIKYQILQGKSGGDLLQELYGIKHVWLMQRISYQEDSLPRDPITKGVLYSHSTRFPLHLLMIQFNSRDGLKDYYEDRIHADLRRALYKKIYPNVTVLWDLIETTMRKRPVNAKAIKLQYEIAEETMRPRLQRSDYHEDELIKHMVLHCAPFPFKMPAKNRASK